MIPEKIDRLLLRTQKPARYCGGEPGSVIKEKDQVDLRIAFCFPDLYEVGMSHLGMKILYSLLNSLDYIWCERVFAPWMDMEEALRRENVPLYALESKDPLGMFERSGLYTSV